MHPSKLKTLQERKALNWQKNITAIRASEFSFEIRPMPRAVLFSGNGKPPVNFYPSTERWLYKNITLNGTAEEFLVWYRQLQHPAPAGILKEKEQSA